MHITKLLSGFIVLVSLQVSQGAIEVVPPELRGAVQPQVAVAPSGWVYIAFGKGTAIYCAASLDGGRTFKTPVQVGSLPKLALGMRRGPRISATDQGIVVTAVSHEAGNLSAWTSSDGGTSWSSPLRVNDSDTSAREGMHAMAGDGRGAVHMVWLDLRNKKTELWGASSKDGGKTWGANARIYKSPDEHICECCSPSIAVDARGNVWAMWRNWLNGARDLYVATSADGGKTYGAGKKLGTGSWPLKGCPMDGGDLSIGPNGKVITVWRRETSVYTADDSGPEKLLGANSLQPVVAIANGATYFVWQKGAKDSSKLMLKKGDGAPQVLADSGSYPAIAAASPQSPPLVVWEATIEGSKTIFCQRLE